MTRYYLDTNILLRLVLKDNPSQHKKVEDYFRQAQQQKIQLILMPLILLEAEHVLRTVYEISKTDRIKFLLYLIKTHALAVLDRSIVINAIDFYTQKNVDLTDALLYVYAQQDNATVLSFDKDFRKLK